MRLLLLVSRGGSKEEAFEGFSWGEVVQGGAWAFIELFGDGGQVGMGVPLGRYSRISPLVFLLEPRCHGLWGPAK